MVIKLFGLEAEVLLKMASKETIMFTTASLKKAREGLEVQNLIKNDVLTEDGKREVEWRKEIIERVRDVYDLKPGGGYLREIHFAYEPASAFSYAYNWCGLHGVSIIKTDPRKGTAFFEVGDSKFWLEGNPLNNEEISFNMPMPKTVEKWSKGQIVSMESEKLWRANKFYFQFFLDLKEECFYDVLNLGAFQSWLVVDESQFVSCFFIAVKGAYGGGKSVSCEALIFLGRHGKIANPSVAYLGRSLERLGFTVFMDEFDIIVESDPEMGRLARMCQRRGQSYDRSTKSGVPQTFNVFGPWIMSVHGELEDALSTRTIPLTTEETLDPDVPVVNPEAMRIGQEIYDQMWMWYMDNIDYISYKTAEQRNVDFDLDLLMSELDVVFTNDGSPYVTVEKKRSNFDEFDKQVMTNQIINNNIESNMPNMSKGSNAIKQKIENLRKTVAESILASCTDKQKKIIRGAAGRNIELMTTAFKISNIVGVNCDESIRKAFEIKKEVEEEEREVGLVGHLRDFLVDIYKKRMSHPNYWTKSGLFMISNIECAGEFNLFLHRREQSGATPGEYKRALRELGFIRPTSRRKMDIKTWEEIDEEETKKKIRLANIFTDSVCRKLSLKTEQPSFGQLKVDEFSSDMSIDASLQEKLNHLYAELSATQDVISPQELSEKTGFPLGEVDKMLALMAREGRVFSPQIGYWKAF